MLAEYDLDQLRITHEAKNHGHNIVINETVFAVGFDKNFIIAKSYSEKLKQINYHIIEVKKDISERKPW